MKLILGSILVALIAIPTISSAADSQVRGLAIWGDDSTRPEIVDDDSAQYVESLFNSADGPLLQNGSNNNGQVTLSGIDVEAVLMQLGNLNEATLMLSGNGSSGMILQDGNTNFGRLEIPSTLSSAVVEQVGNTNKAALIVLSNDTSVLLRQVGNNLGSVEPLSVNTDVGSVLITMSSNP